MTVLSNFRLIDLHPTLADFRAEAIAGLQRQPKFLGAKYLYDRVGSQLFDRITELPEYYLTRTELAILAAAAPALRELLADSLLIEFGSGSSRKIRILLDAIPELRAYLALDISKEHLVHCCRNLAGLYPQLPVIAVCADFCQPLELPDLGELSQARRVAFFPGSSVGNFEPEELATFLENTAHLLGPGGGLLIGVDLKKSATLLEPAYDDAAGVSAEFALNLLARLNREMAADFDLGQFRYRACYNGEAGRIEMALESCSDRTYRIAGETVHFAAGEKLRTENSYKFDIGEFQAIAARHGFRAERVWTDPQQWFSLHYLTVIG